MRYNFIVKRKVNKWYRLVWGLVLLMVIFTILVYFSKKPLQLKSVVSRSEIVLTNGKTVKLSGIDATAGSDQVAKEYISVLLSNRRLWLQYKDDGVLVWLGCEGVPKFWAIYKTGENPMGCKNGVVANELLKKIILLDR